MMASDESAVEVVRDPKVTELHENAQQAKPSSPLAETKQDGKNEQKHNDLPEEKAGFGNFWVFAALI